MASHGTRESPAALVRPHFSPPVHLFATPDLQRTLERNRIPSLAAFLEPFLGIGLERVQVRKPSNYDQHTLDRLGTHLVDRPLPPSFLAASQGTPAVGSARAKSASVFSPAVQASLATPSTPFVYPSQAERDALFLDSLGENVARKVDGWTGEPDRRELRVTAETRLPRSFADSQEGADPARSEAEEVGWEGKTVEELCPWFEEVKREVYRRREMVEWETFGWPVACILALSTSHPDPLNALSSLWDLTSPASLFSPSSYPPRSGAEEDGRHDWTNAGDVLRFVVLVHDQGRGGGKEEWDDAQRLHETIRKTYGLHTAVVPLFSASPGAQNPHPPAPTASAMWDFLGPVDAVPWRAEKVVGLGVDEGFDVEPPTPPPPTDLTTRASELSEINLSALTSFSREFLLQSLVPHLERLAVVGHESWQQSRRGFFSAAAAIGGGKLWGVVGRRLGGVSGEASRVGSPGPGGGSGKDGYNAARGYYHHSSTASQSRRLADLAFILEDYKLAQQVYESLAKDYRQDKAWRYYSAAIRMAGLCQLLQLSPPASPSALPPALPSGLNPDYNLLLALQTPLAASTPAVGDFDSLRSTLLYYDLYRLFSLAHLAPYALVRTAGEAEEVVSAILIEQAALAEVMSGGRKRRRKYAFCMAMAAARYEKCGIKSLSRRCLSQASTVFRPLPFYPESPASDSTPPLTSLLPPLLPPPSSPPAPWLAIRTHIHHSLARQAYTVGSAFEAIENFLQLLVGVDSASTGAGEAGGEGVDWLDDFALAFSLLGEPEEAARRVKERGISLPIKLFDAQNARVKVGSVSAAGASASGSSSAAEDEKVWKAMTDEMLRLAEWAPSEGETNARPPALVYRGEGLSTGRGAAGDVEAVIGETVYLEIPARNPVEAFLAIGELEVEVEGDAQVEVMAPQGIELAPMEESKVFVPVKVTSLGSLTFRSLSYRFSNLLPVTESFITRYSKPSPPAPNKPSSRTPISLKVHVRAPVPVLSVEMDSLPQKLFHGEMQEVQIKVVNAGQVPLADLHLVCSHPGFVHLDPAPISTPVDKQLTCDNSLSPSPPFSLLPNGRTLASGDSLSISLRYFGDLPGSHTIRWLFAFRTSAPDANEYFSTRVVRELEVYPSLELRYQVRPNAKEKGSPFRLGVEVFNCGLPADDVRLETVSLVSPLWRVAPNQAFDSQDDITSRTAGWQQSTRFLVAVEAVDEEQRKAAEEVNNWTVGQIEALLDGRELKAERPSLISLVVSGLSNSTVPTAISTSLLTSYAQYRKACLVPRFPTVDPASHPNIFPLFCSRAALLVVSYTSASLSVAPHTAHLVLPLDAPILGTTAGSTPTARLLAKLDAAERVAGGLYEESQRERTALLSSLRRSELAGAAGGGPIAAEVDVRATVEHDFDQGPLTLPVIFWLRNLSPFASFDYTLQLSSGANAVIAGPLVHKGSIDPLQSHSVKSQLWLPHEGAMSAAAYRLAVRAAGQAEVRWTVEGPAPEIVVRQTKRAGLVNGS
ncbi:(transport protein particle) complex protein Trs85 [Rhodotorula toruloides]|uniref:(Transport protein particle) complex protein Trs85 n=1 Tax=Rhodotorula toruloides TaxID=5286 RepID=A0A511K730_RHOTO|nr:(transport protein particle) complex protein Trs85 [Rhodotorula toruloides]